ncbi:hypothetical protein O9402_08265 [Proteus mirabilis]|uniref:hypothetical protein n=1 Tax=Proteus mirabilis TaxID=584 RepID=UPI0025787233|nr:hypothetical protein [Proteus mirabilis]MDM3724344.1 hypothetical protein [Proteus mirabilis]
MTVSTELSHEEYVGNGVTTDFDFRFRIFEGKHLIVVVADSDGNEKTLKNGTDYTIVGAGSYHGGKVVLNKPLAQGWKILLERDLPVVQETDLRNQGKFFAEVHEDAFDYLTMLIQKALGTFSLSLRKPTYLSNYYDAKDNRIANLASPKVGTDAANKDYVDNSIKYIDSKTLRVNDKDIPSLPNADDRAGKVLTFDKDGYPIAVAPASGSAIDVINQIKNGDGSLIGVGNGETLKDKLSKIHSVVTPEMFIKDDDVTHNRAFEEMFIFAKDMGVNVEGSGTYILESTDDGIDITVDTDLSKAKIICTTKEDVPQWKQKTRIFSAHQNDKNITSLFHGSNINKGEKSLPILGLSGHITILSEDVVMLRYDGDTPEPQKKAETNQIFSNGMLKYEQYYNFSDNKKVYYKPHMPELNIKIGSIVLDGAFIRSIFSCYRNNTNLSINKISSINVGHAQAYVEQESCSNFSYNNAIYDLDYNPENLGGYALTYKYTTNTRISKVTDIHGWAGTDGNYARDIKAFDCDLLTVGGHFSMSDITIDSCKIRSQCRAQGWGVFEILNSKHILPNGKITKFTIGTRYDYANSWDGIIRVYNLDVVLGDFTTGYMIVSAQEPKNDHHFMGKCPDIYIDGVTINFDNIKSAIGMEIRGIDLGVSRRENLEKYQILPSFHEIRRVKMISQRVFNRIDFRVVYNNRDYSLIENEEFKKISNDNRFYSLNVSDVDIYKAGSSDYDGYFGVHTFGFTENVIMRQDIKIEKSNNCIPVIKSAKDISVKMANMMFNYIAVDGRINKKLESSNEIFIYNSIVYQPEIINPSGYRACIISIFNSKFDWLSKSPFSTLRNEIDFNNNMGSDFVLGKGGVIIIINGCFGRLESIDMTYNERFKKYISENYKDTRYYV